MSSIHPRRIYFGARDSARAAPVASGMVLPAIDIPLILMKVVEGLYVVENAYSHDYGFFTNLPLYEKECKPEVREIDSVTIGEVSVTLKKEGRPEVRETR